MLRVNGGAFECLQKEEDEEEEDVPGFQSQANMYEEKERKQKEHAGKKKMKGIPPPPLPSRVVRRAKDSQRSKRRYTPMQVTVGKSECGCEPDISKDKEAKQTYLTDSNFPEPPPQCQ